ncbi:recombinase family protein [Ectobacillus polymachus]|uniref:recombinase family protein n=1 Tax=Ectobacillus polymachus TaxID=1508806 RepID=UPI003A89C757
MDRVAIYLRKSRADIEAEARGECETLSKHKEILFKFAKEHCLNIISVYQEIASGESLVHRPEMLRLLADVKHNIYQAVLCVDMDRLGRGNMREQGLILETFKTARTKIITLRKTYDLNDEFDEEYSEFEAFMARKELKIITRRLQRGRILSVEKGNYLGTYPPYGYTIIEMKDSRTLEIHPEQAEIVRMIFNQYTNEDPSKRTGAGLIAKTLNELAFLSATGKRWNNYSVIDILKNYIYIGKVTWNKKTHSGKRKPREEWIIATGKHPPIVSEEVFNKAQEIMTKRYHIPYNTKMSNPLAGIIKCGKCGANMLQRYPRSKQKAMTCPNCDTKSSYTHYIESHIISALERWLVAYKLDVNFPAKTNKKNEEIQIYHGIMKQIQSKLEETEKQKEQLYDFLERGIYNEQIFMERTNRLDKRIDELHISFEKANQKYQSERKRKHAYELAIPNVEKVIDLYFKTNDVAKRNFLLKAVLKKVVYFKERHQVLDDFSIEIYPKLPFKH